MQVGPFQKSGASLSGRLARLRIDLVCEDVGGDLEMKLRCESSVDVGDIAIISTRQKPAWIKVEITVVESEGR